MPNGQDVSNNHPLTIAQRDLLVSRMKAAWANLPKEAQDSLKPLLDQANQQFANFIVSGTPPSHRFHNALRMKSYLTNDWDQHGEGLDQMAAKAAVIGVGPEGEILGTGKYQQLDPCWELVAGTVWLENLLHRHPFPPGAPASTVPIPDQVSISIAGDFGTGNFGADDSPSTKISKIIASFKPHITIHLGDVYYAGTSEEEATKLISYWPSGSIGSFTLNSNHEMYSGGGPYFNDAVGGPVFNKFQSPFSFFALENSNWIVLGLDSAYNAGVLKLYMDGSLGRDAQIQFLQAMVAKKKRMIILTHHHGLAVNGVQSDPPSNLFAQVASPLRDSPSPAYWYWGHKHVGAVYKPLDSNNGMRCRCVGHGALPWALSSDLKNSTQVEWFERCNAGDTNDPVRVFNGFVHLELNGVNLKETFYDEKGRISWTPQTGDPRKCN